MATYTVTQVRMESSDQGGQHEHIEGVCLDGGTHYICRDLVDSLRTGNTWRTLAMASTPISGRSPTASVPATWRRLTSPRMPMPRPRTT